MGFWWQRGTKIHCAKPPKEGDQAVNAHATRAPSPPTQVGGSGKSYHTFVEERWQSVASPSGYLLAESSLKWCYAWISTVGSCWLLSSNSCVQNCTTNQIKNKKNHRHCRQFEISTSLAKINLLLNNLALHALLWKQPVQYHVFVLKFLLKEASKKKCVPGPLQNLILAHHEISWFLFAREWSSFQFIKTIWIRPPQ